MAKMVVDAAGIPAGLEARVTDRARGRISDAINQTDKHARVDAVAQVKKEAEPSCCSPSSPTTRRDISRCSWATRSTTRCASRCSRQATASTVASRDEVRPISIDIGLLPRAHGSALFTRGQTQALVAVTLGTANDVQRLDTIDEAGETTKSFMLHYNFPPFSTGEVRPMRGTSRREIGHGHLAERALQGVLPDFDDFPYTIRIVSDVLESNGSSSMASVCGGSLALFDAGVPMRSAVAGVAMGLIKEGARYAILTRHPRYRRPPR